MFVEIVENCEIECLKKGNKYFYDIKEDDVLFNLGTSTKSPTELTKQTEIGKAILKRINENLTPKELKTVDVDKKLRLILDQLDKDVQHQENQSLQQEKDELEALEDEYQASWVNFEYNRKKYGYSRLEYIIRVFEGLGVDAQLEMMKAYIGYLQTFLGLKGTNVIGVGSQSSGKTHCLEKPLECIPQEYVHKGTFTQASFFRLYKGQDLTSHIFYLGDLGGTFDDTNTIESRDVLKQLSTDGYIARSIVDEDSNATQDIVTGTPSICYTTVSEEIINEQERSRSIILRPPDVDQRKLMIFDSFQEATGTKLDLKNRIESNKKDIQGFSWWLKKNIDEVEMYNVWMFCVQRYLSNMDDFNRKIKEFNMLLKIICILNDSFKLQHQLYDDFENDVFDIDTTILIPSKQEIIDALTLFEGSTGLLPSEIALSKGILKVYSEFPYNEIDEENYTLGDDPTYEEIIQYNAIDSASDYRCMNEEVDEISGKSYLTGYTDGVEDLDGETIYCFFTIDEVKKAGKNQRWYREVNKELGNKLYKLYNFGILIKLGKNQSGKNVYGIGKSANEKINSINPKFEKKDVDLAVKIFHERYPELIEDFDAFVEEQRKLNVKKTNFEIKDHLYDLEWNKFKLDG